MGGGKDVFDQLATLHEVVAAERIDGRRRCAARQPTSERRSTARRSRSTDRVANAGGMDTVRRAEAVEVFKVIWRR